MGWYDEPTSIESLENVDSIFAIDENGTPTLKNAFQFNNDNRLFIITGIHINMEDYKVICDEIMKLKNNFWDSGLFKGERVVLHSKDIRKKQGPFNPKNIDYNKFKQDLDEMLNNLPIQIYSSTIDKKKHCEKYYIPRPVYELGVEFIIERFCFDMRRERKKGIVILESRGTKEDDFVLQKMKELLQVGNDFNNVENFSCIKGVYFNPKRTKNKKQSYWILEISDLISYRIHKFIKTGKEDDEFNCIKEKIFGYPNYEGKGLKIFPKNLQEVIIHD